MANPKVKAIGEEKVLVNLDKISATAHLTSVELIADIKNGSVVKLGDYQGQDYYKAAAPADLAADRLVFVAASILPYDIKEKEEDVILKSGERVRAYFLERGDMITITDDGITGASVVGQFVVPAVGAYKLKASATKVDQMNFVVVAKENYKGHAATVLEVI